MIGTAYTCVFAGARVCLAHLNILEPNLGTRLSLPPTLAARADGEPNPLTSKESCPVRVPRRGEFSPRTYHPPEPDNTPSHFAIPIDASW